MEKYLTIKELSFELEKLGLPSSRGFIEKQKKLGAPFLHNRILLSEFLEFLKKLGGRSQAANM